MTSNHVLASEAGTCAPYGTLFPLICELKYIVMVDTAVREAEAREGLEARILGVIRIGSIRPLRLDLFGRRSKGKREAGLLK